MSRPSNLANEQKLEENLRLADAALNDPSLVPNHIEAKLPHWLSAYKEEALEVIEAASDDKELIQRLLGNVSRVDKALLAYRN